MNINKSIIFLIVFLINSFSLAQSSEKWVTIYSFSGSSQTETDDFLVKESKWRAIWKANSQYENVYGGNLIVYLVDEKDDEKLIVNALTPDQGNTVMRSAGRFYLRVESLLTNWTIEIQVRSK